VRGSTADRKRLHVIVAHFSSKRGSGIPFGKPGFSDVLSNVSQLTSS
jgi:hypothetical protein